MRVGASDGNCYPHAHSHSATVPQHPRPIPHSNARNDGVHFGLLEQRDFVIHGVQLGQQREQGLPLQLCALWLTAFAQLLQPLCTERHTQHVTPVATRPRQSHPVFAHTLLLTQALLDLSLLRGDLLENHTTLRQCTCDTAMCERARGMSARLQRCTAVPAQQYYAGTHTGH